MKTADIFVSTSARRAYWIGLTVLLVWMKGTKTLDSDEGITLEGAWSLINAQDLYTGSFQYIPPGSFYLVYWVWKAVGLSYAAAKLIGILSILLTAAAIFTTSRLVAKDNFSTYAAPLLYCLSSVFWVPINHNTFSACFLAWATYFCARGVAKVSTPSVLMGGLLTGLSGLFLLHKEIALFFAVIVFYLVTYARKRGLPTRHLLLYVLSATVPLAALALKWPPGLLFDNLVTFPALHYWKTAEASWVPLILAASCVVVVFLALRGSLTKTIVLLLVVQAALLGTSVQLTDWSHTLILMFPTWSLAAAAYEAVRSREALSTPVRYLYAGTAISAGTLLSTVAIMITSWWPPFHDQTKSAAPLLGFLEDHCPSLYVGPWMPGLYFETRRSKPISYPWLVTGLNTDRQFLDARAQLEVAKPQCAVVEYTLVKKFNYDQDNPVDRFIRANYAVGFRFWSVTVYVTKDSSGR